MEQEEKLKTAGIAIFKVQTIGGAEKTTKTFVNMDKVKSIINDWNTMSKKVANRTIEQDGPPNEATESE